MPKRATGPRRGLARQGPRQGRYHGLCRARGAAMTPRPIAGTPMTASPAGARQGLSRQERLMPRYSPDATHCVICTWTLRAVRKHVDTCSARCFRTLLTLQRDARLAYPHLARQIVAG
jgi:hypothetical protein